jgi:hypothetical protein
LYWIRNMLYSGILKIQKDISNMIHQLHIFNDLVFSKRK